MSASTLTERWRLRRPLGPEDAVVPGILLSGEIQDADRGYRLLGAS